MIATSPRNASHQLDEPNVRDMQHPRSSSMSPPRRSPSKHPGANNRFKSAEQQNSTDSDNMTAAKDDSDVPSEECVTKSSALHDDIGEDDAEEMNSSSSQCSCRLWTCSQCNKAFNSARALKIHQVKQHENMPKRYIRCSHCDEVFEHGNLLQIHMKVHHNIKVRCPQCKDIFDHPKALSIHVKAHNTEPVCPVCGVKFDHDKLLKLHMEHYHKVSKNESTNLPSDQLEAQTFQPLANLISPDCKRASESPERRRVNGNSLSPNDHHHHRDAIPSPGREESTREGFHEVKSEERNSRHRSQSPQEVPVPNQESMRRELFARSQGYDPLYRHRLLAPVHNRPLFYRPMDDKPPGPRPYGMLPFEPLGLRRRLEKRPLGRSHSLPLKQEAAYHDMGHVAPWQWTEANPMMFGPVTREKRIDRAVLEAVRNNLKAKLRTVEATLLGEEGDPHHPLSSTLAEYYEQQGALSSREELSRQYRPSVITPRSTFDSYPFKRKASPSDIEPQEKMRRYEEREGMQERESPSGSPSRKPGAISFIPGPEVRPTFHDPVSPSMYARPFNTRDDLSILKRTDDFNLGDQAKIFIKRGAPRCNRCQQTFSSKMEYLHHLISHREKDGFADETPEEMEFIEGVRRSMNLTHLAMEGSHRASSNASPEGSLSPKGEESRESQKAGGHDGEGDKAETKVKAKKSPGEQPSPLGSQESEGDSMSLGTATCSECKDVFADSMSCRMHIEKRHMKPRCRECGLTFDHKNLLKIHMDCYHSTLDVLQCYYCGMSFKQRSEFLDHLTSHETQEINKDKLGEHGGESTEPGGRRRWGRLVASAQLPSEKPDPGNKERIPSRSDFLGTRENSLLKSNGKTKLRKAVSLSTYTDMINRNKRSAVDFLRDSRAKGDEVIGRETRTRIFLPNFEDRKAEDVSRFHPADSMDKELASPMMPRHCPSQEDNERLFLKRKAFQSRDSDEGRGFWSAERLPFTGHSMEERQDQVVNYSPKKEELRRLRSAPGEDTMRKQHMPLFRKAFIRDEVETLYQLRHKKSLHNPEGKERDSPPTEPSNHRSDLVKIERIELNPIARQHKPLERVQRGLRPKYNSDQRPEVFTKEHRQHVTEQESHSTRVHPESSPKRYHEEATTATSVVPPPLIDIRRFSQTPSPLNVCSTVSTESSPASSRSNSPLPTTKTSRGKSELEASISPESIDSSSSMKDLKGKRRNSIKKMTKEALINSLSLKRRASAPDLYQMQRDSTENASAAKAESPKTEPTASPGSPSVGSDGRASPMETKHHGSRSQQYTPRKQSERDVTCTQCGVSFGHKKLYKIHLDSYHGKPQNHECLQCGSKNFRDKDEFLKHLMAHQAEGKSNGDEEEGRKTPVNGREGSEDSRRSRSRSPVDMRDVDPEMAPKTKIPRMDIPEDHEKGKDMKDVPDNVSQVIINMSKNENDVNDESGRQSPRVNNNAKDLNDKGTTCFTCGKTFENGKQLEQHFSSHASISEDGRFCCALCGKAFETHRKLEIHSRSHTGFKPHKCEQCGRCFPYYSSYYYHKMTHTKDRPHKCPLCGKGFIQTRYLRSHLRTHKDEQGTLSAEVESIIQKVELNMNEETDEESIDSPGTAEGSPAYRANDEEAETAEILCSFKRGLNCSGQNSDAESPTVSNSSISD